MTLIYSQQFVQGIVLVADNRASKPIGNGKYDPWRDNTQKIFRIKEHIFISFCGDIEFAGAIIGFLIHQANERSELGNLLVFHKKGPKLIKFAYEQLSKDLNRRPDVDFIVAGIDFRRPETVTENGKFAGYMAGIFEKRTFKISCPSFEITESNFFNNPSLISGSGTPALDEKMAKGLQGLYNFNGMSTLEYHGMLIADSLKNKSEELGISSVGGLFQIVTIDQSGSRFIGYKSRSKEHKDPLTLDLEMTIRNGKWVQRDLKTGTEIALLSPPEVVEAFRADGSQELFALLN